MRHGKIRDAGNRVRQIAREARRLWVDAGGLSNPVIALFTFAPGAIAILPLTTLVDSPRASKVNEDLQAKSRVDRFSQSANEHQQAMLAAKSEASAAYWLATIYRINVDLKKPRARFVRLPEPIRLAAERSEGVDEELAFFGQTYATDYSSFVAAMPFIAPNEALKQSEGGQTIKPIPKDVPPVPTSDPDFGPVGDAPSPARPNYTPAAGKASRLAIELLKYRQCWLPGSTEAYKETDINSTSDALNNAAAILELDLYRAYELRGRLIERYPDQIFPFPWEEAAPEANVGSITGDESTKD